MSAIPAERREKAVDEFLFRKVKAMGCLAQGNAPEWKRVTDAMQCFKGLRISDLPPKLQRSIDKCFVQINWVTARYTIQTWEDYQKVSPEDLTTIGNLIIDLM